MSKNARTSPSRRPPQGRIELIPVTGLPEIREGDDLARTISAALRRAKIGFQNRDILVVAQKIISKAEGRIARLSTFEPSAKALQLAARGSRDPRLVEVILRESRRIIREHPVLIVGLTNVAVGAAGVPVMLDLRGTRDRNAKRLQATILAIADDLAAAAGLAMGKQEGVPVVIVRGYKYRPAQVPATKIIRPAHEDLFR